MPLPNYFPFMHGVYDVKAGISALGKDLGNAERDRQVFQIDEQFSFYHAAKLASIKQRGQHVLRDGFDEAVERGMARWMADRLVTEYPTRFAGVWGRDVTLDDLALHVQEDLAVLQVDADGSNRLAYLHVCMPSGWPPEEKIGRPFDVVHQPVPHIGPINAKQDAIAKLMVHAGKGAVRFAWTVTTDSALNHHPNRDRAAPAPTPMPDHVVGEPLLRVERQVIQGFIEHHAALFTIRTYLYPFESLDRPTRQALAAAVSGMSEASLRYKNMDRGLILDRLSRVSDAIQYEL